MIVVVKLSEWAKANGVSRQSACRWFHAGVLPVPAYQLSTGTIPVGGNEPRAGGAALCARLSSADQRSDPHRQVARPAGLVAREGFGASRAVSELGSGLDGGSESQAAPRLPLLPLRPLRSGHRPGPQRSLEPGLARGDHRHYRYRQWGGNQPAQAGERTGRGEVHGYGQVLLAEPSRRHQPDQGGQDRHRHPATGGSEPCACRK